MPKGQKHIVKCRCVLPQYKKLEAPPQHRFVVFSIINDDETIVVKYAQCNNCGLIHKVTDICTSEILKTKENMSSIIKIEDIKPSIHPNFSNILEVNSCDIATWEAVQFIVESKRWGDFVVLNNEAEGDEVHGKYIRILGESLCKVEPFSRSSGIIL